MLVGFYGHALVPRQRGQDHHCDNVYSILELREGQMWVQGV